MKGAIAFAPSGISLHKTMAQRFGEIPGVLKITPKSTSIKMSKQDA